MRSSTRWPRRTLAVWYLRPSFQGTGPSIDARGAASCSGREASGQGYGDFPTSLAEVRRTLNWPWIGSGALPPVRTVSVRRAKPSDVPSLVLVFRSRSRERVYLYTERVSKDQVGRMRKRVKEPGVSGRRGRGGWKDRRLACSRAGSCREVRPPEDIGHIGDKGVQGHGCRERADGSTRSSGPGQIASRKSHWAYSPRTLRPSVFTRSSGSRSRGGSGTIFLSKTSSSMSFSWASSSHREPRVSVKIRCPESTRC